MTATGSSPRGRRGKAALFVVLCSWAGVAPHWLEPPRNLLPAASLTLLLGAYVVRTVLGQLWRRNPAQSSDEAPAPGTASGDGPWPGPWPPVDVVVAARDEQAVVGRLVERVSRLLYRHGVLRLWVVDDGSEDRTPEVLKALEASTPMLRVLRRPRHAGGGKSGALNAVLEQLEGRWMLVLDADAGLQEDLLEQLIPRAEQGGWSAMQLRKAVVNAGSNLLTRAQAMEMALDAVVQEGRLAGGGVAELRGNGQLLRRDAITRVGGFNEDTVTDDLDLSFRLLLAGEPVGVLWDPPVEEEAVLTVPALWRQRQRWAEGGLQRFFDYWPGLCSERLNPAQKLDLSSFFLLQYVLPMVSVVDLFTALVTRTAPTIWPLSIVALGLSGAAIVAGCRRPSEGPPLPVMNPLAAAVGIAYLTHWFVVIPWVTLRMALLPKRLVWAKTQHLGGDSGTEASPDDLAVAIDPLAEPLSDPSTQVY
ncbi:glycosyltransferase family 2 protein [Synechococcus sp. CBW1107]|uniref:glycosyltransferase n=1 Tax=Synechococcus sp. CBW1107 TaxID=2789857 RepID=UPI0018CCC0A7|nr:glycosyltransferase family 2 protein [Synechococcus sp. CBW1107]QPN57974.1 glycosyltransferase family 2 protein [Synechococcus sp. CBW1107]